MTSTSRGSLPDKTSASWPTAATLPLSLSMAIAEGSSMIRPRPAMWISVLTVPRSIATPARNRIESRPQPEMPVSLPPVWLLIQGRGGSGAELTEVGAASPCATRAGGGRARRAWWSCRRGSGARVPPLWPAGRAAPATRSSVPAARRTTGGSRTHRCSSCSTGRFRWACRSFHRWLWSSRAPWIGPAGAGAGSARSARLRSAAMRASAWPGGSRARAGASRSVPSTSRSRRRALTGRGQPDQRAPPVARIALALEQALPLEMADDLADHRLGPAEVRRRLADGERPGHRQVLQHRAGRARQLAPRAVAPVKRQVHGPEGLGEPLRPHAPVIHSAHVTRVPAGQSIVNPDGPGSRLARPGRRAPAGEQRPRRRARPSRLPFEDANGLLHRQPLGLRQEPVDEPDRGQAEDREAHHDPRQPDGVVPDGERLDERVVGQPVDAGSDGSGPAPDGGREDLALDQPAR